MPTATPIKYRHYPTAGLRAHLAAPPQQGGHHPAAASADEGSLLWQLQGDTGEEVFRLLNSV